jgi:hypothetical protein
MDPTSFVIPGRQQVGLRPIDYEDGTPPIGLCLTETEFREYIAIRHPDIFDQDILDIIYRRTYGHVGAITDFINVITSHNVSCKLCRTSHDLEAILAISPQERNCWALHLVQVSSGNFSDSTFRGPW